MNMRVWWIPQVPMKPFHVPVKDIKEAKLILKTLGRYDQFQLENKIKPDYCNAGGLEVEVDGEWEDWMDSEGRGIDEIGEDEVAEHCTDDLQEKKIWGDKS